MSTVSAGLVKATNLTVTGLGAGAVQATNLNFNNLDISGNLTVGGNISLSNLASLYTLVKQLNLADLTKMFDEFEAVIQQTNEAYLSYMAYKCEDATYQLTTEATSAYAKEFLSNLAKQLGSDQDKPLYTLGIATRDQCIDLEVAMYNRITDAQTVWETLEGISEYTRSVASRMFLYMKSWLEFSFYSVRDTRGTTNYIKGKCDMTDFGTYICNMLNIPFDSVYGLLATSISLGINHIVSLVNIDEREDLAFVEDVKVLYDHLLDLITHQVDDYITGLSLNYKFDKNDLYGVGTFGGPVFSGLPDYVSLSQTTDNTSILNFYRASLFNNQPVYFDSFCNTIRAQYLRVLEALGPRILSSGSLLDDPSTYQFDLSSNVLVNWENDDKLYPMDLYPDGTPLSVRIRSTQVASNLAAFSTFDSNTYTFISENETKVTNFALSECSTALKAMKSWSLEAPISLPLDSSANIIHWSPNAIGHGVHQSDLHNYKKYPFMNGMCMKYNVTEIDSSNNIVLDRKHLCDLSDDDIYGTPGKSIFEIAKSEFQIGPPAFADAKDGLLAYTVGDFTSVGGINTSETKITNWDQDSNTFTLDDVSLYSIGTIVLIRTYSAGSWMNSGGVSSVTDVFPGNSEIVNQYDITGLAKDRYGADYLKYRIIDISGNNVKICIDSDESNAQVTPKFGFNEVHSTVLGDYTFGEFCECYMRPWSEPILLSNGVLNYFMSDAYTTPGSLTNCFLELTPGSVTILFSWITFNCIRNVRVHQYEKVYDSTVKQALRSVPTLGYCADSTKGGIGAEFRTKTETGWSHDWGTQINYSMVPGTNGAMFGGYGMDETINGHSVPYALQIARGNNQLDVCVHHSSFYEHYSEFNQNLIRYRAFEMWDPIYAIDSITDNTIIYNKGTIDGFKRRNEDVQFDIGDPVRVCFFDCSGSSHAQSLIEGVGLTYVSNTPTSDYYFVKEVTYDSSGHTLGIKISETKNGGVVTLNFSSITNAYIVNSRYEVLAGQFPFVWNGHLQTTGIMPLSTYLIDLENYQNYYNIGFNFWNWARHSTLLQIYGYGGYFSEYYAKKELLPLWSQLHGSDYTMDDYDRNVDNRLMEFTKALNLYNTWDWNLIQISLNEYKASLEALL